VLKLTLYAGGYDWQFVPIAGQTFTDSGSGACHGAPGGVASARVVGSVFGGIGGRGGTTGLLGLAAAGVVALAARRPRTARRFAVDGYGPVMWSFPVKVAERLVHRRSDLTGAGRRHFYRRSTHPSPMRSDGGRRMSKSGFVYVPPIAAGLRGRRS
jgi:hypothetical protein